MIDGQDYVYVLAASPAFARDGICFAARVSGLHRSADGGASWAPAYATLALEGELPTLVAVLSPAFPTDGTVFAGVAGGVLRSLDRGLTWEAIPLPAPPPTVTSLVVSPDFEQDGQLFAGTLEDGVFRSADRGRSWHAWNFQLLDLRCLALAASPAFAQDETLFAATETGLYRSTNGGRAWREAALPDDAAPVLSLALSPAYAADQTLFAGTDGVGLLRSRDRGHTWETLGGEALAGSINAVLLDPGYPQAPGILVLCDDQAWHSCDDGLSWVLLPGEGISALAAPAGLAVAAPVLAGGVDGTVWRLR